jgi:hypothetical protein
VAVLKRIVAMKEGGEEGQEGEEGRGTLDSAVRRSLMVLDLLEQLSEVQRLGEHRIRSMVKEMGFVFR